VIILFKNIFILLLYFSFTCCYVDNNTSNEAYKVHPSEEIKNFSLNYTDSGRMVFKIISPLAIYYDNKEEFSDFPQGLTLSLYNYNGKILSTINSSYARLYDNNTKVELADSVVLVNQNNEKLLTEYITWDIESEILHTNESVTIITENEIIHGEGFVTKNKFKTYEIKNIHGVININDD